MLPGSGTKGTFSSMLERVLIPRDRRAVVIGPEGETKQEIESTTQTRITVEEDILIEGEDVEKVLKARDIVQAIGRGFNPETALQLISDEFHLHLIQLSGESKKTVIRLMGRVIGRRGATKRIIEDTTNTQIAVYGKTVGIIGHWEDVEVARQAVEDLLNGRSHGYVYRKMLKAVSSEKTPMEGI